MRRIVWVFCLLTGSLFAQPGFNIGNDYGYFVNLFNDVVVHNDTIVAYGIAQDTAWPYQQGLLVARFDTMGNKLNHTLILDTTNNIYSTDKSWGKIIATSDGGYAMTTGTLFGRDGVFIKLKHDLTLEFNQRYRDTINLGEFLVAPIEVPEGYLLYGYFNRPGNEKFDALIRKVDKQGNLIWRKNFGQVYDLNEFFTTATIIRDSLILITGGKFYDVFNMFATARPWLCIFNVQGNLLYEWEQASPELFDGIHIGRLIPQPDSTWIAGGAKFIGVHPEFGWDRYQTYWVGLNKNFQYQWHKPYGPNINKLDVLLKVIRTPQNEMIAFGQRGPHNPDVEGYYQKGWIMRFSATADSLWEWIGKIPTQNPGAHYFSGGDLLSSGSIIAAGSGDDANGYSLCWLVKLSPDGCVDTIFCHTSPVKEPVAATVAWGLEVYPNPASGVLHVRAKEHSYYEARFFDLKGQMLNALKLDENAVEFDLPIRAVPSGLYVLQLLDRQGVSQSVRIVVNH